MTVAAPPTFFFGAMSPYSWFAAERIEQLLPEARWRGVLAGAVFKHNGRVSWGLTEHRERGIADCEARAELRGLGPIVWPEPWPTSDLLVARAMAYCTPSVAEERTTSAVAAQPAGVAGADLLRSFALAAMRLAFLEGANLGEAEAVIEAGRRAGVDAPELREALEDPPIKDALRAVTADALAAGVFGVPTVLVGTELFWGDDRLQEAASAYRSLRLA
jgi:2-hydroxychromene-2-carboxylate isomerase